MHNSQSSLTNNKLVQLSSTNPKLVQLMSLTNQASPAELD